MYLNYEFTFRHKNKHIFVPNDECLRRGKSLLRFCSAKFNFPPYFFHYQRGGHVAALHRHIENQFFFRIDIENFFYSISRRRVAESLHTMGYSRAREYAKWSCVRNPGPGPTYALPIGFIQSPVLASIVMLRSPLAAALERANANGVFVSVYFDDFVGSSMNKEALADAFGSIQRACVASGFVSNEEKLAAPAERLEAFNCDLQHRKVQVTERRIEKFFQADPTEVSIQAFNDYCARVANANH